MVDERKKKLLKTLLLLQNISGVIGFIGLIGMGLSLISFIWVSILTSVKILLTFTIIWFIFWLLNKTFVRSINIIKNNSK